MHKDTVGGEWFPLNYHGLGGSIKDRSICIKPIITPIHTKNDDMGRYGCMMMKFKVSGWNSMLNSVSNDDVWYNPDPNGFPKGGKEFQPHVTLLYGFHDDVNPDEVFQSIRQLVTDPIVLTIKGIGFFEGDERDVVKLDIQSDDLTRINQMLRDKFPFTNNFPDYQPHATISYVTKGSGSKYQKEINKEIELKQIDLHWSSADDHDMFDTLHFFNRLPHLGEYTSSTVITL